MSIKTDLAHHYKDRNPEKTIQIIENFFNSHNITIRNMVDFHSEINTYSCTYGLFWNNKQILSCNGKGTTPLYSKASCFSELYERFCANIILLNNNIFIRQDITKLKKNKYNYYYYPTERKITTEEYLNNTYISNFYFNTFHLRQNKDIDTLINILFENNLIGFPYKSLTDESITYQEYNTIFWYLGSTGLATGNSIEEALVQGCSEIFERIVAEQFFCSLQTKYYSLDYSILQPEVQDIIKQLDQLGYQTKVFDLSYNYNLPVCFITIYNKNGKILYYRMGAAPIFDIAVERCFTELYQGWQVLPNDENVYIAPYEAQYADEIIRQFNTSLLGDGGVICLPYFLFNNIEEINHYNTNIFLSSKDYSNEELLNKVKEITINCGLHLNWLDISLSPDIKAVHIVPQENVLSCRPLKFFKTKNYTPEQMVQTVKMQNDFYNLLMKFKNTKIDFNAEECLRIFKDIADQAKEINPNDNYDALDLLTIIFNYNTYKIYNLQDTTNGWLFFVSIMQLLDNMLTLDFPTRDSRKKEYENYKLYEKLQQNGFSINYIKHIFTQMQKEYLNYNEYQDNINIYLLYILYIKSFYDLYNSQTYQDYLNLLLSFEEDRKKTILK